MTTSKKFGIYSGSLAALGMTAKVIFARTVQRGGLRGELPCGEVVHGGDAEGVGYPVEEGEHCGDVDGFGDLVFGPFGVAQFLDVGGGGAGSGFGD